MADVSDSGETVVDQNNEVSSSKSPLCDEESVCEPKNSDSGSKTSNLKFGGSQLLGTPKNHFSLRSSLLAPSLLTEKTSGEATTPSRSIPFVLNPPRLSNPFAKSVSEDNSKTVKETEGTKSDESGDSIAKSPVKPKVEGAVEAPVRSVSFVPLKTETPPQPSGGAMVPQPSPSLGFVFGENLRERVVEPAVTPESSSNVTKISESASGAGSETEPKTNGTTTEMLFTAGAKREIPEKAVESGGKTLSEAAREYEEARAVKRKYEAVTVVTGEEEESNVLQVMNCKLFAFDKCTCSWVERGRGTLRLNDIPSTNPPQSRLIVRVSGSLRLVLNTKIWGGMSVGRASHKSLRITAMDSSQVIKVFLVVASPKEIDQLQKALEWRVNNLKKMDESEENCQSKKTKPENQEEVSG